MTPTVVRYPRYSLSPIAAGRCSTSTTLMSGDGGSVVDWGSGGASETALASIR